MSSIYSIEYLPGAKRDLIDIIKYINKVLKNSEAAKRLSNKMVDEIDRLSIFPYICPVYLPIRLLQKEYRFLKVDNFIVLYTIDEKCKLVTISRVVYNKRNRINIFE